MEQRTALMRELERYSTLWRESSAIYEEWAKAHGMSLNDLLVLLALHEEGEGCTQRQISRKWFLPKQTVNTVLKEFEGQGYLELTPTREDRRAKAIRLTEAGLAFAGAVDGQLRDLELAVMAQMGLARMKETNDGLEEFIALFRQGGGGHGES